MAETAYERFLKDPDKEEAVNIEIKDQKPLDLDQVKFKIQEELTGTESWPYNPLSVLGRTRGVIITHELGIPDEDNEWQFDGTKLYHRRMNNEVWYFTYTPSDFYLSEQPIKL